jgi:nicotinamidase-related amidase
MLTENENALLVVIDPQKDFIHPAGAYANKNYGLQQILRAKDSLIKLLNENSRLPVVIIQSDYKHNQFDKGLSMGIPGTFGHQIDIPFNEAATVITKEEHNAFTSKAFTSHLKRQGYKKLFITGFLAEYCVKATAVDALKSGFEVILITYCIGTGDSKQQQRTEVFEELKQQGAKLL